MASNSELESNVRYCYQCGQSYPQPHPESCEKCGSTQFAKKYAAIASGGGVIRHVFAFLIPIYGIYEGLIQVTDKDTRKNGYVLLGLAIIPSAVGYGLGLLIFS